MKIFWAIIARDLRLAARSSWQVMATLLFFLLVIVLLAFGVGPDPKVLQTIAPGRGCGWRRCWLRYCRSIACLPAMQRMAAWIKSWSRRSRRNWWRWRK